MIEAVKAAETAKKKAELTKKMEKEKGELKTLTDILDNRRKHGLSTAGTRVGIEYTARKINHIDSALKKLK